MTRIPDRLYFKIGMVSKIADIKPYILRYWESEFDMIRPQKTKSNQRVYSRKDVELILEIKRLIYKEKFTLEGAKKQIRAVQRRKSNQLAMTFPDQKYKKRLKQIRDDLSSIQRIMK
ncbi:MAG: MerR family transcriptional regulator [Thermodesulfobacteriota bacterium]